MDRPRDCSASECHSVLWGRELRLAILEECIILLSKHSFGSDQLAQRDLSHEDALLIESSLVTIEQVLSPLVFMRSLHNFQNSQGDLEWFRNMSSLPRLMMTFRASQATDLRDKIAAVWMSSGC
jgi:hypothetical protein